MTTSSVGPLPAGTRGRWTGDTPAAAGPRARRFGAFAAHLARFRLDVVVPFLAVVVVVVLLHGLSTPIGNESIYSLLAYRASHPTSFGGDWTFTVLSDPHPFYHALLSFPLRIGSIDAVTLAVRVVCWLLILVGLLRLGRRFELPHWATALALIVWLSDRQSLVGAEWIIGGLEAKVLAYVSLLFAFDQLLGRRHAVGGVLLGLTVCLHQPVGAAGVVGALLALVAVRTPWREFGRTAAWTGLVSLPGLWSAIALASGTSPASRAELPFVVEVAMPFHFDPTSFTRADLILLGSILAFCALCARDRRGDRTIRFVAGLLGGLALVFIAGLAARAVHWYAPLMATPFRVLPVLAPPLFLFMWMRTHLLVRDTWPGRLTVVVGMFTLLGFAAPLVRFKDRLHARAAAEATTDATRALRWVAANTPGDATVIAPPWIRETFYHSRRAQIANWELMPLGHLREWRDRIEAMTGPLSIEHHGTGHWRVRRDRVMASMQEGYARLGPEDVARIVERFGGEYLVHDAELPYDVVFATATYRVYRLPAARGGGLAALAAAPATTPAR